MTIAPTRSARRCALVLLAISCLVGGIASGDITLRTGERINEPIEAISMEGITVRGATTRIIGWETIQAVRGPRADDAQHFMPMAEQAWRARIRLARGDLELAEPLLEALFAELRHRDGSAALLAAEGLMRCRLAGADVPGAVLPWIEAARLRHEYPVPRGGDAEQPPLDRTTHLSPALPPFFATEQAERVIGVLSADPPRLPERGPTRELLAWYRRAAEHDAGRPSPDASAPIGEHPGVRFVADLVLARTADDPQDRAFHRNRLRLGLEADIDTWREAWRRAGLGMSHLAEGDDENAMLGVLELLHIPARFGTTQPQLAGLALVHAANTLDRLGSPGPARRLRDECRANYPDHPALPMLPSERPDAEQPEASPDPLDSGDPSSVP